MNAVSSATSLPAVLIAEDDREVRECLQLMLECQGFDVAAAGDGEEALDCLREGLRPVAVILDIMMPNLGGFETLREIRKRDADLPVVMMSGLSTPLNIVSAIKCGASDFLAKPLNPEDLRRVMGHLLAPRPEPAAAEPPAALAPAMFFGRSPAMLALRASLATIAASDAPILIEGETGSGKEMLARQIHELSPRARGPFIKLNCAAVPAELLESELFGYERGAFTGAQDRKPGVFELANGGTLLLDEIGDMEWRLQAKLLQVVQDQEFRRLGGRETVRVDVRLLSATHCNLPERVAGRTFREDLYYRLNVFTLTVPALRERREDIPSLTAFLLHKHNPPGKPAVQMTARLEQALLDYHWPGNIRQLENTVRKLVVLRDPDAIAEDVEGLRGTPASAPTPPGPRLAPKPRAAGRSALEHAERIKAEAETKAILEALQATRWNRKRAAQLLGVDYKAFLYKMKKLGVEARAEISA